MAVNSFVHGLRALTPVFPGLERAEDWEAHREAIVSQLAPVGAIEYAFAERIALGFWRLARCAAAEARRSEDDKDSCYWNEIRQAAWQEDFRRGNEPGQVIWEHLERDCADSKFFVRLWDLIESGDDGAPVNADEANRLIDAVATANEWSQCAKAFNEQFTWPPREISQLRQMLEWLSQKLSNTPKRWLRGHAKKARATAREVENRKERIRRAGEIARERAIVGSYTNEYIARYETTIHRALLRDTHELQRIQAMRLGIAEALPVAVDVTTDG